MKLEFNSKFQKDNNGIKELLQILSPNGRVQFDLKKGHIIIEDFPSKKIDDILSIITTNFEISSLNLNNNEKTFKIRNDEKELSSKKEKIQENFKKNPNSIVSKIQSYIFDAKVFSLTDIRTSFPNVNFGTIRAYVKDLKHDNIIIEIERGKYAVR